MIWLSMMLKLKQESECGDRSKERVRCLLLGSLLQGHKRHSSICTGAIEGTPVDQIDVIIPCR